MLQSYHTDEVTVSVLSNIDMTNVSMAEKSTWFHLAYLLDIPQPHKPCQIRMELFSMEDFQPDLLSTHKSSSLI